MSNAALAGASGVEGRCAGHVAAGMHTPTPSLAQSVQTGDTVNT